MCRYNYDDLISKCRYYNGENESENSFAYYEKFWIDLMLSDDAESAKLNSENIRLYLSYDLLEYSEDDGIPLTLKALLFNRHMHWSCGYGKEIDVENFKKFYEDYKNGKA